MFDADSTLAELEALGLGSWRRALEKLVRERFRPEAHGDAPRWRAAIERLPVAGRAPAPVIDGPVVRTGDLGWAPAERETAREALMALLPWRKGPFEVDRIAVDSEWRSDWKWQRVRQATTALAGRKVLDVGCGNGYYALRMLGEGARHVIGVDPTLLCHAQFAAVNRYLGPLAVILLPLRLEELPENDARFDTTLSMGVLYHSRSPLEHLRRLRGTLKPAGELVLETLILPGEDALSRTPPGRYARMRNVWHLPTAGELETWLERSGFVSVRIADVTATTIGEQRRTAWMPFDSFGEALDPADSARTVEGWPAPRRAVLVAERPRER